MKRDIKKAIFQTLAYADIFDYPLTKEELWKYLISSKPVDKESFRCSISDSDISRKGRFYFLKGRHEIVWKRIKREKESKKKIQIAKRVALVLSRIPTVKFIGVSGALAMNNCEADDDIDLFLITSSNTLWITRFIALFILEFLGVRRSRKDNKGENKICLNMIITQAALSLPGISKDIYLAHEIAQLKQLYNKNDMHQFFMGANAWIQDYMYNSIDTKLLRSTLRKNDKKERKSSSIFEKLSKKVQLWSIIQHHTTETITDSIVAFHPIYYRKNILTLFKKRLDIYEK